MAKQVKQRRESIDLFAKANRADLVEKEERELGVLSAYLPAPLTDDELAENGGATGLLLLRESGKPALEKIQPNQIPTGVDRMIEFAYKNAQIVSGVDENMLGTQKDLSGVAVQSLQYAAQQKLAIILNNLSRTRRMVLERTLEMVQRYMGAERVIRIAEDDLARQHNAAELAARRNAAQGTRCQAGAAAI